MKECIEIDKEILLKLMEELNHIYDVVRIVEPLETSVVKLEGDHLEKAQFEPCFAVWEKDERCDNCISLRACMEKRRMTKFEFRSEEVYNVVAMPLNLVTGNEKHSVVLELVNHISDDIVMQAHGTGEVTEQVRKINRKMYEDSLTRVFNRRYYDEKLYIYEMAHSLPKRIGFLMIDLNRFKNVNDTFGHEKGDELLIHVAEILKDNTRETDKVMRFGGDEFLVVLRDCNKTFAEKKVKQFKREVSRLSLDWMGAFRPSIAVGLSYSDQFDGSQEQVRRLCKEADEQMYLNKSAAVEEKQKILVASKEKGTRKVLKGIFGKNFQVSKAESTAEILREIKEHSIRILIADAALPEMEDFQLIKTVRSLPETETMLVVAVIDREETQELHALEAGADDFIQKPLNEKLVLHRLKELLNEGYR